MLQVTKERNPIWAAVNVFLIATVFFFGGYLVGLSQARSEGNLTVQEAADVCKEALQKVGDVCIENIRSLGDIINR